MLLFYPSSELVFRGKTSDREDRLDLNHRIICVESTDYEMSLERCKIDRFCRTPMLNAMIACASSTSLARIILFLQSLCMSHGSHRNRRDRSGRSLRIGP